jgi:hypothetical protein
MTEAGVLAAFGLFILGRFFGGFYFRLELNLGDCDFMVLVERAGQVGVDM